MKIQILTAIAALTICDISQLFADDDRDELPPPVPARRRIQVANAGIITGRDVRIEGENFVNQGRVEYAGSLTIVTNGSLTIHRGPGVIQ